MGFTAVNGRGPPPDASRTGEAGSSVGTLAGDGLARAQMRRGAQVDAQQSVSPLSVPGKRKRAGCEGEEDMSDDSDSTSLPGHTGENLDGYVQPGDSNTRDSSWNGRPQISNDDVQLVEALQRKPHTNSHWTPSEADGAANVSKQAFANRTRTGCCHER